MKTFAVKTLGCKVNQYESQALQERLLALGYRPCEGSSPADIYVINTCSVTHKADADSRQTIRSCNRLNPKARILVTGCSVQNNPDKIKELEGVSLVADNNHKEALADFLTPQDKTGRQRSGTISHFANHTRAFVKIQDGCNNGCSYCVIPRLRGRSHSRPAQGIINDARNLVSSGYKEIVLCGICLGDYGKDNNLDNGLVRLIDSLEKIDGLLRIRLSSIEATDISPELINKMAASEKLCRHLHIPFQSGDDSVLRKMNRKVSCEYYRRLIRDLRALMPDIGITTDIMAGFPGEGEDNFNNTVRFLEEIKPHRVHIFPFSPRKNTPAFNFAGRVSYSQGKERTVRLRRLAKRLAADFCSSFIGRTLNVLIETGAGAKEKTQKGYSDNYIKVYLNNSSYLTNSVEKVKAIRIHNGGLMAE